VNSSLLVVESSEVNRSSSAAVNRSSGNKSSRPARVVLLTDLGRRYFLNEIEFAIAGPGLDSLALG